MAYAAAGLQSANVGVFQEHVYHTADNIATTIGSDYFLSDYRKFNVGDTIRCVCSTGGTRTVDLVVVQTCTSAGMTVVNGT